MRIDINSTTKCVKTRKIIETYIFKSLNDDKTAKQACTLLRSINISIFILLLAIPYYLKIIKLANETSGKTDQVACPTNENMICKETNIALAISEGELSLYDAYILYNKQKKRLWSYDDDYTKFLVVIILVNKYFHDTPYSNVCWSNLAKVNIHKLSAYEDYLLSLIDYNFYISHKTVVAACKQFTHVMGSHDLVRINLKYRGVFGCILTCFGSKYIKIDF